MKGSCRIRQGVGTKNLNEDVLWIPEHVGENVGFGWDRYVILYEELDNKKASPVVKELT